MRKDIFVRMLTIVDQEFCKEFSDYLSSTVISLDKKYLEDLLYENKYYHTVSNVAKHITKQEWFKQEISDNNSKYKNFLIGYRLEEMLGKDTVDKKQLETIEDCIVSLLASEGHSTTVSDMVVNNYISVLTKHYPEYLEMFKVQGYSIVDQQIASNKELTPNMLIFDCNMMKTELGIEQARFFEFYDDENDRAFAHFHAGNLRINTAGIKPLYENVETTTLGTQYLFFVLGHELGHASIFSYRNSSARQGNVTAELSAFNTGTGGALQNIDRELYKGYHDNFTHEYYSDIYGIRTVYARQKYLPSVKSEDMEEFNKAMAGQLFGSYAFLDEDEKELYISPVDFTNQHFAKHKNNLPARHHVRLLLLEGQTELSSELLSAENALSEEEKFMLGYHNKYIGILNLIRTGQAVSTNLFDDLPDLYIRYRTAIEGKYPQYSTVGADDSEQKIEHRIASKDETDNFETR